MSLARELTLGPNGGRRRRSPQPGRSADYAALRRLTDSRNPDLDVYRATLLRVGRQESRMRIAEVTIYTRAVERFAELTGEWLGPRRADRPEATP